MRPKFIKIFSLLMASILLILLLSGCSSVPTATVTSPPVTVTYTTSSTVNTPTTTVVSTFITPIVPSTSTAKTVTPTVTSSSQPTTTTTLRTTTTTKTTASTTPISAPKVDLTFSTSVQTSARGGQFGTAVTCTLISITIKNSSDYSVDATYKLKVIDSQGITISNKSITVRDIWQEETYYTEASFAGTKLNVSVTLLTAAKTIMPSISKSTDLTILESMPVKAIQAIHLTLRNNSDTTKTIPNVEVRIFGTSGRLIHTEITFWHGATKVDPHETVVGGVAIINFPASSDSAQNCFIYLLNN
jgi:hypothetical protein